MSKHLFYRIIVLIVIISLLCVNVFAAVGDREYFTRLFFTNLGNTQLNRSGYFKFVSDEEMLTYITMMYDLNIDFYDTFYQAPYSIQNIEFGYSFNTHVMVPCMIYGDLTAKVSGWYSLHGMPAQLTINQPYYWSYNNMPFPGHFYVNNIVPNPNTGATYNVVLATDDESNILAYMPGSDNSISSISQSLSSIVSSLSSISNYAGSMNTTLSSILTGINTSNSSLSTIATRLSTINTNLTGIANRVQTLISNTNLTNEMLDQLGNFIVMNWPNLEADLESIDSHLVTFNQQFNNYASTVLTRLQSIDTTVNHMDDTLDEMMDHFNGEALKDVPVEGTNMNLWSVIKSSVSNGISGLGSFFKLLFGYIGHFAGQSSGSFGYIDGIDHYNDGYYTPQDLTGG